jgi:hypothetical protein
MAITSEPGGTYSVIFNAHIDPSDRTAQTAADMLPPTILKAVESTETIAGAIPTRTFTPGVYTVPLPVPLRQVHYYIRWQRSLHFRFGAAFSGR